MGCIFLKKQFQLEKKALKGLTYVESYAIVYTYVPITQFKPFDLLILESDSFNRQDIYQLRQQGKSLLAYINIGEFETYRPYANEVSSKWLIAKNPIWENHYYIDPGQSGWHMLLKKRIIPQILDKGFHGFFFDSVDMASQQKFPKYKSEMVNLIKTIRKGFPNTIIVLNNAEFLLEEVVDHIDGLLIEDVFTEMKKDGYITLRSDKTCSQILHRLASVKKKHQIPIFFVDYFPTEQKIPIKSIYNTKNQYGLIPYITDVKARIIFKKFIPPKNSPQTHFMGPGEKNVS